MAFKAGLVQCLRPYFSETGDVGLLDSHGGRGGNHGARNAANSAVVGMQTGVLGSALRHFITKL